MNVFIIEENPDVRDPLTQLVSRRLKSRPGAFEVRDASHIEEVEEKLADGFMPDVVFCATSLDMQAHASIAQLMRERNAKTFICFMSGECEQFQEADLTVKKTDIHVMIDVVLGKACRPENTQQSRSGSLQ